MRDAELMERLDALRSSAVAFAAESAKANPERARRVFEWLETWCEQMDWLMDAVMRSPEPREIQ